MPSQQLWRAGRWILGLLVLAFVARTFARNWEDFQAQDLHWALRPVPLFASVTLVWAMYAMLIAAWRGMLTGWGDRLGWWDAVRIWTVSNLGKYIPGKVWAIAGMALMARQAGVSAWTATASAIVLQALAIGTGAFLAAIMGTGALEAAHPGATIWLWIFAALSVAAVALLVWPAVSIRLIRLALPDAEPRPPAVAAVLFGIAANLLAWCGYGAALWLLTRAVLPDAPLTLAAAIGAFAASYVAGLLFLVVPGGIGVREGVFIVLLQGPLGIAAATGLAVASRLLLTVTELGAAVPFILSRRGSPRGTA